MMSEITKHLYVKKRDGSVESVHYDAIIARIKQLCYGLDCDIIDPAAMAIHVVKKCLYPGVTTSQLDDAAAEMAITMTTIHPDYEKLAARLAISNLHKQSKEKFSDVMTDIYQNDEYWSIGLSDDVYEIIMKNKECLDKAINYEYDYNLDYFGFKNLMKFFLAKYNNQTIERPQHLFMKIAVAIHGNDIDSALETYRMLAQKLFVFSPVVIQLQAAAKKFNMPVVSHYSVAMIEDSIDGIYDTLNRFSKFILPYSTTAVHVHKIRAAGTYIRGSNGKSSGLPLMLKQYDTVVHKCETPERPKSMKGLAVYCELWHSDIMKVLDQIRKTAIADLKLKDSYVALWIPDEFMRRVENNQIWSFMSPDHCPGLVNVYGKEFEKLYKEYENKGSSYVLKQIEAKKLWSIIIQLQIETSLPLIVYKDACNMKSNENHLGTIQCAGRNGDTVQYTAPQEVATCTNASIAVDMFLTPENSYDFFKLKEVARKVTFDLNKIINKNESTINEEKKLLLGIKENQLSIGIGIYGLADLFIKLRYPFDHPEALDLNKKIHETIYYGSLEASCELAAVNGPYKTFSNSPASKGLLQFDLWGVKPTNLWDWDILKKSISKNGLRNSLVTISSPTDIESQIFGKMNSVEPLDTNVKCKYISFGENKPKEYQVVNQYLLKDLFDCNLWDENIISQLINDMGSVQNIKGIPEDLKNIYKTKWEIDQNVLIKMAVDRAPFIDQSQALVLYMMNANEENVSKIHMSTWKLGLKTGLCQLRVKQTEEDINE
ncbi:ribonucleoside-diphosphate reductase large subunit-like [Daktulosphaira vitifoliae]|uniref:ribonucleoside-diphosphate reductase large subunit-like n=1 Tax=Daktulosphaira vitifoliae TaxID=58002 RepID=UPI0021AAB6B1|nr:ribonucleoside-diphosphate reductase large subunit-like [Daktulosphaira vitifoliae]